MKLNTNLKLNPNFSCDNLFTKPSRRPLPGTLPVPPRPGRLPPCWTPKPSPGGVLDGILVPGPIRPPRPSLRDAVVVPGAIRPPLENRILNRDFRILDGFDLADAAKRSR